MLGVSKFDSILLLSLFLSIYTFMYFLYVNILQSWILISRIIIWSILFDMNVNWKVLKENDTVV